MIESDGSVFTPRSLPTAGLTDKVHPRSRELLDRLTAEPLPAKDDFHKRLREIAESFLKDDHFVLPLWFGMNAERRIGTAHLRSDWDVFRQVFHYGELAHDCGCVQASLFFMPHTPPRQRRRSAMLVTATPARDLTIHQWTVVLSHGDVIAWERCQKLPHGPAFFEPFGDLCPAQDERLWVEKIPGSSKVILHGVENLFSRDT